MVPGSRFSAILNGRKRELIVVGTALSPEFIYTMRPGETITDDRRFGIIWMSEKALANVYDLDGAFSSVPLKLLRHVSEREVIKRLDILLDRYGGQAAYGRKDQTSHAWVDHEPRHAQKHEPHTAPDLSAGRGIPDQRHTLSRLVALSASRSGS